MSLCPRCGIPIYDGDRCLICGLALRSIYAPRIFEEGTLSYLESAFRLSIITPKVYKPILIGGIIRGFLELIALYFKYPSTLNRISTIGGLFFLFGSIIVYILSFASMKIGLEAYFNRFMSLRESIEYTLKKINGLFYAVIFVTGFGYSIFLIPVASLTTVIIVHDESNLDSAIREIIDILRNKRSDFLKISIIPVLGSIILASIPIMGGVIQSILIGYSGFSYLAFYLRTIENKF